MKIRLSAKHIYRMGIFLILYGNLIFQFYPSLSYLQDVLNMIAIVFIGMRSKNRIRVHFKPISVPLILLSCVIAFGCIYNGVDFAKVLWGVRNNVRFFVWFFFIYECIDDNELRQLDSSFIMSFRIHIVLTIIQYMLGHNQDTLGGIFGTVVGSNGALCIYLIVILLLELNSFVEKKISLVKMIFIIAFIMLNSALAEIKVLFLLVPIFIVLYFISSYNKQRLFLVVAGFVCILPVAMNILFVVFPEYENFFTIDNVIRQLTNTSATYSTQNDIGRSAVFVKIPEIVYRWTNSRMNNFIGIGLGNGDFSTAFNILNSDFYDCYGHTHYTWFMSAMLLVETGYIGVVLYLTIFICIFFYLHKEYKEKNNSEYQLGCLICVLAVCMFFYNSTLRMGYGYMVYTILAAKCALSTNNIRFHTN